MKSAFYKLLDCGFEYPECEYTHIKHLKSIHLLKFIKIILKNNIKRVIKNIFQGKHFFFFYKYYGLG